MPRVLLLSTTLVALAICQPVLADDLTGEVDKIFAWATPATPGCAVAVSRHGKVVVNRAYGSADLERDVAIAPDTVFDVGSVTKQFVAAAVLLLVEDGRVSLSDDIRTHIPELPVTGHTVTVDHLLTHTGGIRDWTGIQPFAAASQDALTITLRQRGLNFAPGEAWAYSNSGYVLLKELVARRSGTTFGAFAGKRLFEPLGMTSTRYLDDLRDVVKRRALAYEKVGGRWRLDVLLDDARGGGGALLSTAGDLLVWNEALTHGRLGVSVAQKLQEPARLANGRALRYGRGLFLDANRGGPVIWHSGSAGGYKALLSRYPEQGLSIAILCNAGELADRVQFARRIFDVFAPGVRGGEADAAAAAPAAVEVPDRDLKARAGLFVDDRTGESLRLTVQDARLRFAGGPALVALAPDRFRRQGTSLEFLSGDPFELRFASPDEIELVASDGRITRYRRARPTAPTPGELQALAGRYESDEMGTVFQVSAADGGLAVRLAHAPARSFDFRPVDRDTFQRGQMTVRFRRDATGNVIGFGYSNPLVRNVAFTRIGDRAAAPAAPESRP